RPRVVVELRRVARDLVVQVRVKVAAAMLAGLEVHDPAHALLVLDVAVDAHTLARGRGDAMFAARERMRAEDPAAARVGKGVAQGSRDHPGSRTGRLNPALMQIPLEA